MKNLIITGVVGLVFFGASYAGSTLLLQKKPEEEKKTTEAPVDDETDDTQLTNDVVAKSDGTNKRSLPAPFKPKTLTEDSILKMVESIRLREQSIKQRERELLERESKHQMVLNDIQREKREYEAIVKKVQARIAEADQVLQLVNKRKLEIEEERKKIESLQKDIASKTTPEAVSQQKNVKKIADYLTGMPAEEAAKTLKAYANDGNLKFAAGILREIEERIAAKILTALEDPILVTQLLDEIKNTKHFTPPKR